MMKPKIRLLLIVIASFIVFFVVGFLVSGGDIGGIKDFAKGFEQGFEREFVASYSPTGAPKEACQCLATALQKQYSMTEITKWSITGSPENFMDDAAVACGFEPS